MKREELEAMGLTKEQVDQIIETNGSDIENAKKESVKQIETLTAQNEGLQGQLDTANETLKCFDGVDVNDLKGQISTLTQTLETQKQESAQKLADMAFEQTLKDAITSAKGRSAKAIMAELDMDTLKGSKNQKEDIEAALTACKEANDFLFQSDEPFKNPTGPTGGDPAGDSSTATMRAIMGLPAEQAK